jgi:hypothetical protein
MLSGRWIPPFYRNILPLSSVLKFYLTLKMGALYYSETLRSVPKIGVIRSSETFHPTLKMKAIFLSKRFIYP